MNKGVIRISKQLYRDMYDVVCLIFKDFKPLHIENEHWNIGDYIIYGESVLFDIVKEGEIIPYYNVIFNKMEDETYSFEFIKQ